MWGRAFRRFTSTKGMASKAAKCTSPFSMAAARVEGSGMKRATMRSRYGCPGFQYWSFRSSRMNCPLSHSTNLKGPVPTGLLAFEALFGSCPSKRCLGSMGDS